MDHQAKIRHRIGHSAPMTGDAVPEPPAPSTTSADASEQLFSRMGLSARWRNWTIRCVLSVVMLAAFVTMMRGGPMWMIIVVISAQFRCFYEVINIGHAVYRANDLPWFRSLSWYFLLTSSYFFYGESIIDKFGLLLSRTDFLAPLTTYHRFLSFSFYCIGFVMFVLSLKKDYYFVQFSLFAWTHMALLLLDIAGYCLVSNLFEGLIWFAVPFMMIVCNDCMAYVFGFFFGRTPLIKLSPKKTWEGFIGGAVSTVVLGVLLSYMLLHYQYLICPAGFDDGHFTFDCSPVPHPFRLHAYSIGELSIKCYPFLVHAVFLSIFSSVIGPFGGFFASGLKRACKVKDFADVIPGHGGIMDRMDCQVLMAIFVQVYINTFIRPSVPQRLLQQIFSMPPEDQVTIYHQLHAYLDDNQLLAVAVEG